MWWIQCHIFLTGARTHPDRQKPVVEWLMPPVAVAVDVCEFILVVRKVKLAKKRLGVTRAYWVISP